MKKLVLLFTFCIITQIQAQGWGEIQKIVSSDRSIADLFGWSVDIDGDYAVIGARGGGPTGVYRGIAYVFKKDASDVWNEVEILVNSDNANSDEYGYSVTISGNYIFIGAPGQDYTGNGTGDYLSGAGAVYIYEKDASDNWNFMQKIVSSDREASNHFGAKVSLHNNYAIIGVLNQDYDELGNNYMERAGAAYIFERNASGIWNEVQKIVASDRNANDYFGRFDVSIDDETLIIGAKYEDEDASGINTISGTGSVYIFERDGSGTWNETQKIVASDREQSELFGSSVDIYGNIIVVGAEQEYLAGNISAQYGAAYIFEKDGSGEWNEIQKIVPNYLEHQSKFGQSVTIDGDYILLGAYRVDIDSVVDGGAAFMFEKDGAGIWNQVASIYDNNVNTNDFFGSDVAVSGGFALVGAYQEDEDETGTNTIADAGSVYIFDINESNTLDPLTTLSVVDNIFGEKLKVYPNPTSGRITIDLDKMYTSINIVVCNVLGQEILSERFVNLNSIDLKIDEPQGLYFLEVKTGDAFYKLKVLKQ